MVVAAHRESGAYSSRNRRGHLRAAGDDADVDNNVIFPIERLRELASEGVLGSLTENFFSFIGYNMDPDGFERTVAHDIAEAIVRDERADIALLALAWPMGHHCGIPVGRDLQKRVLFEAFSLLETTQFSGTIRDVPLRWADVRREAKTLSEQGRKV
jgi:hypothetical protein